MSILHSRFIDHLDALRGLQAAEELSEAIAKHQLSEMSPFAVVEYGNKARKSVYSTADVRLTA